MKKIKDFIYVWKLVRMQKMPAAPWFKIVQSVMDLAVDVQQNGKPMLTKIAAVNMNTGEKYVDIVSIWAAQGDANPIERIKHLKAQNDALKNLLIHCRSKLESPTNDDLLLNIKIVLDTFE